MLLRLTFPSGRYYAARAEEPSRPEWPPHPGRLYSALVAAAYRSGSGMTATRRAALEWLEQQPPPHIAAPHADLTAAPLCYVPPGDIRGQKGGKGEERYEHGLHRWRQPRHFPSAVILGDPCVWYGWELDPEARVFDHLTAIAAGITHLGTSHSMAVVALQPGHLPLAATFVPDPGGKEFLRVPVPGRLSELDAIFAGHLGVRRPIPACEPLIAYRTLQHHPIEVEPPRLEFIVLRLSGLPLDVDRAAELARALRRAVMAVLGDQAPEAVHGHGPSQEHVAWLPLPDVGHPHAAGRILGLGVGLPRDLPPEPRATLLSALARLDGVRLADGRRAELAPLAPAEPRPLTLLPRTWIGPSATWSTVTPVVLDRPPKRPETSRLQQALIESLIHAGCPSPETLELSPFSRFTGAPAALRVPSPDGKPRFHATLRFDRPLTGPLIAGRQRFFGVGLFRPLAEHDEFC